MYKNLIINSNRPFADIIIKAIKFSEMMHSITGKIFPFALINFENDLQSVFVPSSDQLSRKGIIARLHKELEYRKLPAKAATTLLVYSANVKHSNGKEADALVVNITTPTDNNMSTVYPFEATPDGMEFGHPFNCQLSS